MFVSSVGGDETLKTVVGRPGVLGRSGFSRLLDKEIAHREIGGAISTEGSSGPVGKEIGPGRPGPVFRGVIPEYSPMVSRNPTDDPLGVNGPGAVTCLPTNRDSSPEKPDGGGRVDSVQTPGRGKAPDVSPEAGLLPIGTVSRSKPTVSHLLIRHPSYGKDCWKILHSGVNRDKPFNSIPVGSRIYLDPKTFEVVWNRRKIHADSSRAPERPRSITSKEGEPLLVGTISRSEPTVSHLLIRHPSYGKDCWKILHSGVNRDKPFNSIPVGSRIYLDPVTGEILWEGEKDRSHRRMLAEGPSANRGEETPHAKPDPFSAGLVKAVKPYIGRSYRELDCFELLAQGLEEMGVPYYGRHGLGERLVEMAEEKGLSRNHYLSGEGIIEISGARVYSRSVERVRSAKAEALEVFREVEPLLHEGLILSFSTPTRGHTGIVSHSRDDWTYINSGSMDNRIQGRAPKGVGEEFLKAEIHNWFRLAARRGERLQITVGRLDADRIREVLAGGQVALSGTERPVSQHLQQVRF